MFAFLGCVLSGSTDTKSQNDDRVRTLLESSPRLGLRIARSRVVATSEADSVMWAPEQERINNVVTKNARGHALFECGELLSHEPDAVTFTVLQLLSSTQREEFETGAPRLLPEVGCKEFIRAFEGADIEDGWIVVQGGSYRYAVDIHESSVRVRMVIFEYLAAEVLWH